jgi:hypothetical protein
MPKCFETKHKRMMAKVISSTAAKKTLVCVLFGLCWQGRASSSFRRCFLQPPRLLRRHGAAGGKSESGAGDWIRAESR